PICGGFDLPSVVTVVTYTLPPVTIGEDHPRPGISCDHSTFSVFDQLSASRACFPTGFDSGPRNCGQARSCALTLDGSKRFATNRPARLRSRESEIILSSSGRSVFIIFSYVLLIPGSVEQQVRRYLAALAFSLSTIRLSV